jgi:hypothetical protein
MESVRKLDWSAADAGNAEAAGTPETAGNQFDESQVMGAGGFEPP